MDEVGKIPMREKIIEAFLKELDSHYQWENTIVDQNNNEIYIQSDFVAPGKDFEVPYYIRASWDLNKEMEFDSQWFVGFDVEWEALPVDDPFSGWEGDIINQVNASAVFRTVFLWMKKELFPFIERMSHDYVSLVYSPLEASDKEYSIEPDKRRRGRIYLRLFDRLVKALPDWEMVNRGQTKEGFSYLNLKKI